MLMADDTNGAVAVVVAVLEDCRLLSRFLEYSSLSNSYTSGHYPNQLMVINVLLIPNYPLINQFAGYKPFYQTIVDCRGPVNLAKSPLAPASPPVSPPVHHHSPVSAP